MTFPKVFKAAVITSNRVMTAALHMTEIEHFLQKNIAIIQFMCYDSNIYFFSNSFFRSDTNPYFTVFIEIISWVLTPISPGVKNQAVPAIVRCGKPAQRQKAVV